LGQIVVGISDFKTSKSLKDEVITYALGSCVGVAAYDAKSQIGGMLHYLLPFPNKDEIVSENDVLKYGSIAIPQLFQELYKLGAQKNRLKVVIAGGGNFIKLLGCTPVGDKNIAIARRLFLRNKIMLKGHVVGKNVPITLSLRILDGQILVKRKGFSNQIY